MTCSIFPVGTQNAVLKKPTGNFVFNFLSTFLPILPYFFHSGNFLLQFIEVPSDFFSEMIFRKKTSFGKQRCAFQSRCRQCFRNVVRVSIDFEKELLISSLQRFSSFVYRKFFCAVFQCLSFLTLRSIQVLVSSFLKKCRKTMKLDLGFLLSLVSLKLFYFDKPSDKS